MISGVSTVGKSKESSKVFKQIGIKRKISPLYVISDPSNIPLVTTGDNEIVRDASGNIIGNRPLVGPNAGTITYYPGKGPADLSPTSGASKVKHAGRTKASIVAIKNTIIFDDGIVSRKLKPGSKYWAKGTDNKYYEYTAAGRSGRGARTGVPTGVVSDTRPEGPVILPKPAPAPKPAPTPHAPRPTPTPKPHNPKPTRTPNLPRSRHVPKPTPAPKPIPGGPIGGGGPGCRVMPCFQAPCPVVCTSGPNPQPKQYKGTKTAKEVELKSIRGLQKEGKLSTDIGGGLTREISLAKPPAATTTLISSKVSLPVANALVGSKSDAVTAIGVKSKAGR